MPYCAELEHFDKQGNKIGLKQKFIGYTEDAVINQIVEYTIAADFIGFYKDSVAKMVYTFNGITETIVKTEKYGWL